MSEQLTHESPTTFRNLWTHTFSSGKVLDAAKAKLTYHTGRRDWWKAKKEETIAKIRSEGINVSESIVEQLGKMGYSTSNNSRGGVSVTIDPELQQDLQETITKISLHEKNMAEYATWIGFLEPMHNDKELSLTHDDYLFFFSAK